MANDCKPGFFSRPTKDQCKDAGMALVLVGLIAFQITKQSWLMPALIVVVLLLMIRPTLFRFFAALWFGLSELMGTVMSKVILTLVFFLVVTPIALFRQFTGADAMGLKKWKKDQGSVFHERNVTVAAQDLENMF